MLFPFQLWTQVRHQAWFWCWPHCSKSKLTSVTTAPSGGNWDSHWDDVEQKPEVFSCTNSQLLLPSTVFRHSFPKLLGKHQPCPPSLSASILCAPSAGNARVAGRRSGKQNPPLTFCFPFAVTQIRSHKTSSAFACVTGFTSMTQKWGTEIVSFVFSTNVSSYLVQHAVRKSPHQGQFYWPWVGLLFHPADYELSRVSVRR